MKKDLAKTILSQIREDEIVAMCCDVVNIPSPTGEELEMGRYMRRALEDAGLSVTWQEVEEGRANVVGLWEGTGNGKSLMFNGHMDTSNTGREAFLTGAEDDLPAQKTTPKRDRRACRPSPAPFRRS